ncbi:lytic murein transglycosylase [Rheinheimera sp. SA_1]|uniref:lytic murein transglycosylase n=1 Tax=Rheinheimera sp. SA_1 TaxID=1827365 RepID=UPI000A93808E|nr:lytic murein transglycosylase [Rheinheimera sp. SA_1]
MFRILLVSSMALTLAACSSNAADSPVSPAKTAVSAAGSAATQTKPIPGKAAASAKTSPATSTAEVKDEAGFKLYAAKLQQEAEQRGYPKPLLEQVFASLSFHPRAVVADKGQPEFVETLDTYLPKRVNKQRIDMARKMYQQHRTELARVEKKYGVPARFIVSLWGLESAFGRITGNFSVPSALATMAYDGRREDFFKTEFFLALDILAQGHIELAQMKGSWAGAMGHTQFMPSSFMKYAQDGDGDGHKDIWTNRSDAFASIANYLKIEGWQPGLTWGRQVQLPKNFDYSLVIPTGSKDRAQWLQWWQKSERSLAAWQKLGVRNADGGALPKRAVNAALVMPDNKDGRAYLAYHNYQTLMHWNRSYYFVSSVGYLADLISEG